MLKLQEVNNNFVDAGDTYVHNAGVFLCLQDEGTLALAYLTVWKDELLQDGKARMWWDAYDNSYELQRAVIQYWPLREVLPQADISDDFIEDDHHLADIFGMTLEQFNNTYQTHLMA